MPPAISVVVPCYNGGRFLDQMLASLDAQTFRNFETIVVDDGSSDPATIAKLAALPPAVRVVRQANVGLPAARNTGFRTAAAEFVLPLDCDDALAPDFLAEAVDLLQRAPAQIAFVFSHMRATGALEGVFTRRFNRFDQLFLNKLPYCILLRKSAWQQVGGYDETMRDGYEDWEFNIRLTLADFRGIVIPRPLFIYHVSPDGMLMSRSARLHGKLWRGILRRHSQTYTAQNLRALRRRWRDDDAKFGYLAALILVWGGRWLPAQLVSVIFFSGLKVAHWMRVRRGLLSASQAAAGH